jgi:hypothetical protein
MFFAKLSDAPLRGETSVMNPKFNPVIRPALSPSFLIHRFVIPDIEYDPK